MKQPLNAVVAGHLCIDIFPNLENFPKGKFLNALNPGGYYKLEVPNSQPVDLFQTLD